VQGMEVFGDGEEIARYLQELNYDYRVSVTDAKDRRGNASWMAIRELTAI
jgi:hypothetical protein